jgi:hypothetical protein
MCVAELVRAEIRIVKLGDLQLFPRALRQAAHFGIDGLRDLSECQGAVCAADENPSTRSFDVLDGCLEEMRCRSDHLPL